VLTDPHRQREWLAQWRRAAAALAQVHADELPQLRSEDALTASETLLALGAGLPLASTGQPGHLVRPDRVSATPSPQTLT
jgi:hypothetical protein